MSLRIRADGRIFCAAMHSEEPGDTYLHDGISYQLTTIHHVIVSEAMSEPGGRGGHAKHGEWWWDGQEPVDVVIDRWWILGPQHEVEPCDGELSCETRCQSPGQCHRAGCNGNHPLPVAPPQEMNAAGEATRREERPRVDICPKCFRGMDWTGLESTGRWVCDYCESTTGEAEADFHARIACGEPPPSPPPAGVYDCCACCTDSHDGWHYGPCSLHPPSPPQALPPSCSVCRTQAAGMPTPGYAHDPGCPKAPPQALPLIETSAAKERAAIVADMRHRSGMKLPGEHDVVRSLALQGMADHIEKGLHLMDNTAKAAAHSIPKEGKNRGCAADPDGKPCPDPDHCDPCAQRAILAPTEPPA